MATVPLRVISLAAAAVLLAQTRRSGAGAARRRSPKLDSGDTAWMLTSVALVLMMTIPGLALFYGGMVRKMNVLATVMQSFAVTCLVTVLWTVVGYSFAFTTGSPFLGGLSRFLLLGMTMDTVNGLAKTIPESVYMCFQMTFAIITPALICGAIADRMKFSALLWFIGLWSAVRLRADRALGMGRRRLSQRCRRARLCRRHRGPHQFRRRRPDGGAGASASGAATAPSRWRRTISCSA